MTTMQRHIDRIESHVADNGGPGLVAVVDFALATIQQQFPTVPSILAEWRVNKTDARSMFASKRDGWRYVREHQSRLWALLQHHSRELDTVGAIDTLLEIPGLGTVKAGFVAQMLGFEVGCIDSQNQILYDVNPAPFAIREGMTARTRLRKIEGYVQLCASLGGSLALWTNWCNYIGDKYSSFDSGWDVSSLHCECIGA